MAILHNKAGQRCKGEADRRIEWFVVLLGGMGFILGSLTVFSASAKYFGSGGAPAWAGMFSFIALVPIGWWIKRRMNPLLDEWARDRIRYLRGGQGEALVAWLLKDLDDGWHILNNVQLDDRGDIDHVVIGPGGIWCISTKSRRGLYRINAGGELLYNNQPCNWLNEASAQAMSLKDRLQALLGADVPWIEAALAVPLGWVEMDRRPRNGWVLHQDNLVDTLNDRRKVLDKAQVRRCVKAVEMLAATSRTLAGEEYSNSTRTGT